MVTRSGVCRHSPGPVRLLTLLAAGILVTMPLLALSSTTARAENTCTAETCCERYNSFTEDRNIAVTGLGSLAKRCESAASLVNIAEDTKPCQHPEYWPFSVVSERYPLVVHYRRPDERAMAMNVVKYADTAWKFEVDTLGFTAPLPDDGYCGHDGRFDIFLWRGRQSCWVDEIAGSPSSAWGGRMSYMAVDPWGRNGQEILRTTIGHEFNHASQAADNWSVPQSMMEMSATYVEQSFGDALLYNVRDFQGHPEYAVLWLDLDKQENMSTYHMYGAGLYLYFLRDRYFQDDKAFLSRFWKDARNRAYPARNPETIVDVFDRLLAPRGSTFLQSMQEFARWRYYAGTRDDGGHFRVWPVSFDQLPFLSESDVSLDGTVVLDGASVEYTVKRQPMLLGSAYVEIAGKPGDRFFNLAMKSPAPAGMYWHVQAVPGVAAGEDGETVDLASGRARLALLPSKDGARRTLISTLMPDGHTRYDPAKQDNAQKFPFFHTYPLQIVVEP